MDLIEIALDFILDILNLFNSILVIAFLLLVILSYHFFTYIFVDYRDAKDLNSIVDPDKISISGLKSIPLVNIVVPAWKEGELFKKCLFSIKNLNYPKIHAIINAGGNEETLTIANSFKKYSNFTILEQKYGADRPSLGKVRALNECLNHISKGIVYFIDADSYLNNEILLRMIFPLINYDENVVVGRVRPIKSQINKNLVKYLLIDRFKKRRFKFSRYPSNIGITGQNFCMKYEVLKSIIKFSEDKVISTDKSMGYDIISKGYKIYQLKDYRHRIFVDYSNNLREYYKQKLVWVENFLLFSYMFRKKGVIRFILLLFQSLFIILTPILFIFNMGLQYIGILFFFNIYLKKIRKLLFFKSTVDKRYYEDFKPIFYLSLIFFIYYEALITFIIPFHFLYFIRRLKRKKN